MMDHFNHPRNAGRLEAPTLTGVEGVAGKAPYMVLQLRVQDGTVTDARFQTFGCGAAIAAGSMMTELMIGRSLFECQAITEVQLNDALGGLPVEKSWCARLPVLALRNARETMP